MSSRGKRFAGVAVAALVTTLAASGAVPASGAPIVDTVDPVAGSGGSGATRGSYVLVFTGDTLIHTAVASSALRHAGGNGYDFFPMFEAVSLVLKAADLALCHLEVPLDPTSRTISGFPVFSAPGELAGSLRRAGYDGCSTASNHSLDRGASGLFDTLDLLDAAGLGHAGTARTLEERAGTIYDLGALRVGHVSFSYGVQLSSRVGGRSWVANRIDVDRITEDAAGLRARGANFVVVSLHWGVEYRSAPNMAQKSLAVELMDRPEIDLIVGHHPHVLQPVAMVSGKPVAFSLGNFLSNQTALCCSPESEEGAILLVRVDGDGNVWHVADIEHVPTWVDRRHGHLVTPAVGEAAETSRHGSRLSRAAGRISATLNIAGDGLSPREAYRWILEASPSLWQAVRQQ